MQYIERGISGSAAASLSAAVFDGHFFDGASSPFSLFRKGCLVKKAFPQLYSICVAHSFFGKRFADLRPPFASASLVWDRMNTIFPRGEGGRRIPLGLWVMSHIRGGGTRFWDPLVFLLCPPSPFSLLGARPLPAAVRTRG